MESRNPANLDELVCEVLLGDADAFVDACRAARAAQRGLGGHARAGARQRDQADRPARGGQQGGAGPAVTREIGKPYPESLGEVQEIIDTCDFFVSEGRRLYGQTVPSEMPDKQLFTFRNPVGVAAIITAGNFPVAVPSWYLVPGAPVRQRGGLEAGRVRAGAGRRARAAVPRRRAARRRAEPRPVRRPDRLRGPRARARRSGSSTRSASPGRPRSARGSASSAGATSSRPASSWAARTRSW